MKRLGALALVALTGGCLAQSALTQQHNPRSEYEAGAVTISASAPMRWENVVGELRPEFNSATALDYLNVVLPVVQHDVSSRREATTVQVGVDVSGETVQRTETTDTNASGVATTTGRTVVTENPAAPLRRPDGTQIIDGRTQAPDSNMFRAGDGPDNAWPTQNLDNVDPILQYRAAVALHQELVLLDNYLDSAYDPCTQEAWLVRTRLVSTPYARNQPIDAYARIQAWYSRYGDYLGSPDANAWNGLRLVPLLVTDNFERSDSRRYEQLASQIQGSLNGVQGVVAAGLGFNRYLNNLNAILGSQYNNLLTISQLNDSTLSVRLGAALSPTSRYEMQSRSYDITFLVVINHRALRGYNDTGALPENITLGFLSSTDMRHAENGRLLPVIDSSAQRNLIRRLDRAENEEEKLTADRIERLEALYAETQDSQVRSGYEEDLRRARASVNEHDDDFEFVEGAVESGDAQQEELLAKIYTLPVPDELRAELVRWYMAAYGSTAGLPVRLGRVRLPEMQTGVFRDSLTGGLQASVVGPQGLNPTHIRAELVVGESDVFAANSVTINREGAIDARFPSLAAVGIDADAQPVQLRLWRQCSSQASTDQSQSYPLRRNRAALAPAQVTASSFAAEAVGSVSSITPVRGEGEARIRLRAIDERFNPYVTGYEIHVTGAVIDAASNLGSGVGGTDIDTGTNTVRVGRQFGAYSLDLKSLTPNTEVRITVTGIGPEGALIQGEAAPPVVFRVNPPANP